MGMDLEINAIVRKRENHKEAIEIDLAYWRKTYGLRDKLVEMATNSSDLISADGDVIFECKPTFMTEIIACFTTALPFLNDELWQDSIWSPLETRGVTVDNLNKLLALESYFGGEVNLEELQEFLGLSSEETTALMKWEQDPFAYELIIEVVNSY